MTMTDPPIIEEHVSTKELSMSPGGTENSRSWDAMLKNRWAILGTLFFVTAALGLPLLWLSPAFTKSEKWIWSWVIILYTISLFIVTGAIVWWSYARVAELLS